MTIQKLTPEQEKYLPIFRQEYLDIALSTKKIDRQKLENALADAYEVIGKKKPILVILQSPYQAMMAIKFIEVFTKKDIGDKLRDQLWNQLRDQSIWNQNFLWGSHDIYWIAWARFAQNIGVKLEKKTARHLDIMERISRECEWWWPYEGICFVSEKPETKWDDNNRLHAERGPAVRYEDGYELYAWHGVTIPGQWIKDKNSLTPQIALKHPNMEQRRAACEILGWANILKELDAKIIDQDADPQIGVLLEVNIPDIGKENFLKVLCGTGREFALPVPPDMKTALQANAWTWALEDYEYKPEVRT